MLTVNNISCERGGHCVFSGLGFTALAGSITLLRGPNGVGKSSLLRILATLSSPVSGEVLWDNEPSRQNHDYLSRLLYISDKNALKSELTARENLTFWARLDDAESLLAPAAHYFGITPVLDIPIAKLSAGWQRRVALTKLLALPAAIWLLDEPTAHLDEEGRRLLHQLIKSRADQGGIIIMSTHDEDFIKPVSTINLQEFPAHAE